MATVSLDPSKINFGTLYRCEKAFGVKIFPLVKRLERMSGGINVEEFSIEELMTLTMLALDVKGEKPTAEGIMDMSLVNLKDSLGSLVDEEPSHTVDPT